MKSNESCENYLKAIYELQNRHGYVRSVDIARMLGYSKASVCVAMKKLTQKKLVEMNSKKEIRLTASGEKAAADLKKKYTLLKRLLTSVLDVDEQTAAQDACRIEHVISSESLNRLEMELIRDTQLKKAGIDK
ncbi:Transcriptional regulator MntR [Caprobacter fermentans]|uniref:Transcriptional regulator MntR n=1 Tax=Caproicibacter fermentans TaxID=2576756 RepID=A0A6N8I1F5_9FIRM|nr:metal-dependent transcriptional regulator [Caproicibacter fermentans]MVB11748.1 Transcriptional regulator MntR [Caproicibacter fermentans]